MKRRTLITATAAALAAPMVKAQNLPGGPVRIIVGFAWRRHRRAGAGGGPAKLQAMWNLSIVIENRSGAAGVIAADYVSKQPGTATPLMAHINSHALAPAMGAKLSYDAEKDFVPISMVGVTPNILICNADQPAKTVRTWSSCAKEPGKISFASARGGSAQHFALEMFKLQAKISCAACPTAAPARPSPIRGQVNYCFETMTSATPHIMGGKAIALAQTRLKRAKGHPNVTMDESGFPGFEATVWLGLITEPHAGPWRSA